MGRTVSPESIALALGLMSCIWATIAWLMPMLVPDAVRWMLICGVVPSALVGLLVSLIAARGRWRWWALAANLVALGSVGLLGMLMFGR